MAADVTVHLDPGQIRALEGDEPTRKEILRAGYQMAKKAAVGSGVPRRTGRMANSIRGSVSQQDPNAADVSWGQRYYYAVFHEDGWTPGGAGSGQSRKPGVHFLRRAFESYAHF